MYKNNEKFLRVFTLTWLITWSQYANKYLHTIRIYYYVGKRIYYNAKKKKRKKKLKIAINV